MSLDEDGEYSFDESDYDEGPKKKVTKAKKEPAPKKATKAPKAKEPKNTKVKAKKAPAKQKRGDDSDDAQPTKKKTKAQQQGQDSRTYEETYQKKTLLESILDRPDTYVGSIEHQDFTTWVYDEDVGMNERCISFVPALYKIFDEILVNAADNFQRDGSMDQIKVTINADKNTISVWNNGQGIPVTVHSEHGVYIPEMIFGQLLTSSNYDDTVVKVTGGRNGYGAKLTNIFSSEFIVETSHLKTKKKFKQVFRDNMHTKDEPELNEADDSDYTKITFKPDLARFKMTELDKDVVALMTKRVYDVAGCNSGIKVYFNGKRLPVKDFKSYVELYLPEDSKPIFETVDDRWEVAVSITDGEFQQVSFVNSICTVRGGTHVTHVADKVITHVQEAVMKKNKGGLEIKKALVRDHLWVFVKSLIENPAFDSQTKETLTTKVSAFGSKCDLTDDFLKKVITKSEIIDKVLRMSKFREQQKIRDTTRKKRGKPTIAKLDDATKAGTKQAQDCTLIVVEGESAKTNVVAGLGVVGRDHFGAYPLRGKLLNVRDSTFQAILKNQEIAQLTSILGLEHGKQYTDTSTLRYGHLMFMTDQDHDGSHIKGLLINFIHCFWPSLLRVPGFLTEFVTPIVKAHKKKQAPRYFYTLPEFKEWMEAQGPRHGYDIKYLKGLGTSKPEEFVHFMEKINDRRIDFSWTGAHDEAAIDMAFNKKLADNRKKWLGEYKPGTFLDQTSQEITYSDFINKELILFSLADCERSIPSLVDGFKPSQRKVVYTCFKINMKKETKFLVLTGEVQKACAYHHGDTSLHSTIIGLAHNFVGSNNVNLLEPDSSIGSRRGGGTDAAAPRYLSTRLCEITRAIYRRDDDPLLEHLADDGKLVEPKYFVPVIPTVLVNGASGIGTGWSTTIPCYNPRDIVANLKGLMKGDPQEPLHPWYAGFKGKITPDKPGRYKVSGIWKRVDDKTIEISELPIGTWTNDYKEHLVNMINPPDDKKPPAFFLKDVKDLSDHRSAHFVVEAVEDLPADDAIIEKALKLTSSMSTSNMTLFDSEGRIRQFESANAILEHFYTVRLQYYDKRKAHMADTLSLDLKRLDNKARFILAVVNKDIVISNRKKAAILQELRDKKYDPIPSKSAKEKTKVTNDEVVAESDDDEQQEEAVNRKGKTNEEDQGAKDYDYLLSMPLWNLTLEKVQELERQRDSKRGELTVLLAVSTKDMWNHDLDELLQALDLRDAEFEEDQGKLKSKGKGTKLTQRKRTAKAKSRDADEEDEFVAPKSKPVPKKPSPAIAKPSVAPIAKPIKFEAPSKESTSNIRDFFSPVKAKGEESDEDNMTLEQRLAKRGKPSPLKDTKKPVYTIDSDSDSAPKKPTKRKAPANNTDEDDLEVDPLPKKKAVAKRRVASDDDSDGDFEKPTRGAKKPQATEEDKQRKAPAKKPKAPDDTEDKPKKKALTTKPGAKKPKDVDSDAELEAKPKKKATRKKEDSDDEVVAPSTRPSRGGAKKSYVLVDSEDSGGDSGGDSEVSLFSE